MYKCKEGMIDNRMVRDDHQQGIERVIQRKHDKMDVEGHSGKMKQAGKAHFKRSEATLTPRKA